MSTFACRVLLLFSLAMLGGCMSIPPFVSGGWGDAVYGGTLTSGGSWEADSGGEQRGFLVREQSLEVWSGAARIVFENAVAGDGLQFVEKPDDSAVDLRLAGGVVATWSGDTVLIRDREFRLSRDGQRVDLGLVQSAVLFRGHLDPGGTFFRDRVWIAARGADLELERAQFTIVLRNVVPPEGIEFVVFDFDTPHVEFRFPAGISCVWLGDRVSEFDDRTAALPGS
jgi:hypothetical protein